MRKLINITALIFFIYLVLDTFKVFDNLLLFLLMGELPGTDTRLSPTTMLSLITLAIGVIVFEMSARHIGSVRRIRTLFFSLLARKERLPKRRFNRA